eukprot:4347417-Pyramimonas_sp.AAC.1
MHIEVACSGEAGGPRAVCCLQRPDPCRYGVRGRALYLLARPRRADLSSFAPSASEAHRDGCLMRAVWGGGLTGNPGMGSTFSVFHNML